MKLTHWTLLGLMLALTFGCLTDGDNQAKDLKPEGPIQSSLAEQEVQHIKSEVSSSHKLSHSEVEDEYRELDLSDDEKELVESLASQ